MRIIIFICGVPVTVTLTRINEREVPVYIRGRLERSHSYMQKKRAINVNWYFLKLDSADGNILYFKGELPIEDNRGNEDIMAHN